jgi:FKBP-type peptidyl-prolyl cis-trans isomerase
MQKFLTLLVAALLLYYLIDSRHEIYNEVAKPSSLEKNVQNNEAKSNNSVEIAEGNFFEKTLSKVLINVLKTEDGKRFFENIIQPQNQQVLHSGQGFKINNINYVTSLFNIVTTGEGTLGPASCGHIVTVHYEIQDIRGFKVEEQTKTFPLGERKIMPGLDNIIVGMRVGQTRKAIVPAKYAFSEAKYRRKDLDNDQAYKVIVTLREILPANFAKEDEVRIFDDEIAYRTPLLCGDHANFNAKITKLSTGEVLYDSKPSGIKVSMNVGDITNPMIFSHALYGKIPVGTRAVISKGSTFYSFANSTSKIFPKNTLPKNEYFLLELSDFEVGN